MEPFKDIYDKNVRPTIGLSCKKYKENHYPKMNFVGIHEEKIQSIVWF